MAKFEGEWSNYFKIDDHVYWRQGEYELPELEKMSFTLPSDSTLRSDVILLKNGHEEFAQIAKIHRRADCQRLPPIQEPRTIPTRLTA